MANLKEIRRRISSVKSTQQITKAMKMVAAAKLKKAQDAIIRIRPYASKLDEAINELSAGIEDLHLNPYYRQSEISRILIIPVTSDKGLCGSYNAAVIRETVRLFNDLKKEHYNSHIELMCLGRKAYDYFSKKKYTVVDKHFNLAGDFSYKRIEKLAANVLNSFIQKEYDLVYFVYNSFKNPAVYYTLKQQFLPLKYEKRESQEEAFHGVNFIFEPDERTIVDSLIPMALKIQFYKTILDANASEHGARMTSMDKATENAEELIHDLQLYYNKERQAAITKEILEIVGGSTR